MSEAHRLQGISASAGYAEGPLVALDGVAGRYDAKGHAAAETAALQQALACAAEGVRALIGRHGGDSADILEFQVALLDDDALSQPAFDAIATGAPADVAWQSALDAEIAGYEASDDDYFRARAADLVDIRDRVLRALVEEEPASPPEGAILYGADIAPTRFLSVDWSRGGGVALAGGSTASHARV